MMMTLMIYMMRKKMYPCHTIVVVHIVLHLRCVFLVLVVMFLKLPIKTRNLLNNQLNAAGGTYSNYLLRIYWHGSRHSYISLFRFDCTKCLFANNALFI